MCVDAALHGGEALSADQTIVSDWVKMFGQMLDETIWTVIYIYQGENLPGNTINKSINVFEAIHLMNDAWNLVTSLTIQISLKKHI